LLSGGTRPVKSGLTCPHRPVGSGGKPQRTFQSPAGSTIEGTCVVACGDCRSMPLSLSDPRC
jgi:hypothetical protein